VACALIVGLAGKWDKWKEAKKAQEAAALSQATDEECVTNDNTTKTKEDMEEKEGTRDLFLETLSKIGCQYELGEGEDDSDKIYFAYQGENFVASASNEGCYVHLWDTHWGHVELYDIDEFARLKKAINLSNLNCATMTVYTIDEAGRNVDVHCKAVILFISQIPDIENYLRGELNDFFRAHQYVGNEMAKQRETENSYLR
jgi:hypothetical protein